MSGYLHEFTTLELYAYSFKKPNKDSVAIPSDCLKLSCGHYFGRELLDEIFQLDLKCQLCGAQKTQTIDCYFKADVYLIDDE